MSAWDAFGLTVTPDNTEQSLTALKIVKVITYFVTFVILLTASVISKGTFVFMASQLGDGEKRACYECSGRFISVHNLCRLFGKFCL